MDSPSEKKEISPVVGVILMIAITVVLSAVIAAFVFGMAGNITRSPYKIIVLDSDPNHIVVYASYVESNKSLSNVQIGIYSFSDDALLIGPLVTDDSGLVSFDKPNGFDDWYRIKSTYSGITTTNNIDDRSFFVKIDDYLGSFTTLIITCAISLFAWIKRNDLKLILKSILEKLHNVGKKDDEL